jgi:CRP/FNR family transcriptional regulator, cyclic AMP receptor protein
MMERMEGFSEGPWCLREVDIFCDLSPEEMNAIAQAAPMRTYAAGELLYSPHKPVETLFILKQGRVRIFRVSADGRALTTAILTPGTIFGEMVVLGQRMYENFAEALEESVVCVMSRADVHRLLLSDARIALRITEILGARLTEMERRLSETVFKSVAQRIAGTLVTLAGAGRLPGARKRSPQVALTHEQLAALVGTSRETATKVLGEFASRGLVRLGRGRITLTDLDRLIGEAGE